MTVRHAAAVTGSALLVFGLLGTALYFALRSRPFQQDTSLIGVVVVKDSDPRKQAPIPNVIVTGFSPGTAAQTKSDSSGFFRLTFHPGVKAGKPILLSFVHPDFDTLQTPITVPDHIHVIELKSTRPEEPRTTSGPQMKLSDVRVRYTTKMSSTVDQPMTVTTFMAVNRANVPCNNRQPCSPDGLWKAGVGSLTLEAPQGSQFRNVRVSCIAGPCPFTKVDSDTRTDEDRKIQLSAITWADTATFLVEADVVHPVISDLVRQSYPVIFGPTLSFTLPASAEGPSIEAEVNGQPIVFPLGPDLILSWATCSVKPEADKSKLYSCELKPGYQFQSSTP